MSLVIRMLGTYTLAWENQRLPLPSAHKARLLLAYLLLDGGRGVARDRLIGILWPERPEATARRALSNALWQIRSAHGPAAGRLRTGEDRVAILLEPGDRFDVAEFRTLTAESGPSVPPYTEEVSRLHRAVALYRGDLLETCYEDWVLLEQQTLREEYLRAVGRLIVLHKQRGEYNQALTYALRLVAADPLREEAHREVMRLYHLLGRPRAALDQYETLRRLLWDELQTTPTPLTDALRQEIASLEKDTSPYIPTRPAPPPIIRDLTRLPLVGREEETRLLLAALQAAAYGHNHLFLIEGEAGVGKSRLVARLAAEAGWRDIPVGLGQARPMAAARPYYLLTDALHNLLTPLRIGQLVELVEPYHLSALSFLLPQPLPGLPSLPPLPLERERERLNTALARCLEALAPLVLVLEDLHWADEATLAALASLPSRLKGGVLLAVTFRSGEAYERPAVREVLEMMEREAPWRRIALSPLDIAQTTLLLQRALGLYTQVEPLARRLWTETGGNPLLLIETLKVLLDEGFLTLQESGEWQLPDPAQPWPPPASLREIVAERLGRLSPAERRVLEAVAILEGRGVLSILSRLLETDPASLSHLMRSLLRKGFLQEREAWYAFEHTRMQEIVYRSITPARRRNLHRRAAEVLEALHPEQTEALVYHFEQAGERSKALYYRLQAGERTQQRAPKIALEHYERALELIPEGDPAARWKALGGKAQVLLTLARRREQAATLKEMERLAQEMGDESRMARVRYDQGWLEFLSGDPAHAITLLDEAARLARRTDRPDLLGHCHLAVARANWRMGNPEECRQAMEDASLIFRRIGDQDGQSRCLNMLGTFYISLAIDYEQALSCFGGNILLNRQRGNLYREIISLLNVGLVWIRLGDYRQALDVLEEAAGLNLHLGAHNLRGVFHIWAGICHRGLVDLEQARKEAEQALAICSEVGDHNFTIEAENLLGLIAADEGRYEEACQHLGHALEMAQTYHQQQDAVVLTSFLALACLRAGKGKEADRLSLQAADGLKGWDGPRGRQQEACFACYQVRAALDGPEAARPWLERAYQLLMEVADRIQNPELRCSFLEQVPEHRAILIAHELGQPPPPYLHRPVSLPRAGRPRRGGERVSVLWTISEPEDGLVEDRVARRRHRLLRLLRQAEAQGAAPTIQHMADALGVSRPTIKRDLAALRRER